MAQKGVIHISKTGEVFSTVTESNGVYLPVYEVKGLSGAVYEVKALEDIYTLDGTFVLLPAKSWIPWKPAKTVSALPGNCIWANTKSERSPRRPAWC